jgi:hypothetical protein
MRSQMNIAGSRPGHFTVVMSVLVSTAVLTGSRGSRREVCGRRTEGQENYIVAQCAAARRGRVFDDEPGQR